MIDEVTAHAPTAGDSTRSTIFAVVGEGSQNVAVGQNIVQVVVYTQEQILCDAEQVTAKVLRALDQTSHPHAWDGRLPYRGLAPFQEGDADLFFGREKTVADLLKRITRARLVCVAGPSGSGKSSLVQAGLIYALRRGALPGSDRWLYARMSPRTDPMKELAQALARAAPDSIAVRELQSNGLNDPYALHRLAEELLSPAREQRLVLFVDQFEEFFTQSYGEVARNAFLNLLTTAATCPDGRVIILLGLRADFLAPCAAYQGLRELITNEFQLVGAMTPTELVQAVALPALAVGATIEPELTARVIADMGGEPGALPLMQVALETLFAANTHTHGDTINLTEVAYIQSGGVHKALDRRANTVFADFEPGQEVIARRIFSRLVAIRTDAPDTRRAARLSELVGGDTPAARGVVLSLVAARLLTSDVEHTPSGDVETISLAHEKLIDAWPWLHKLVSDKRAAIAVRNRVEDDTAAWESRGRDPGYLYGSGLLAFVRSQITDADLDLNHSAQAFLVESEREAYRRERTRYLGQAAGGAIGVGLGYGIYNALCLIFEATSIDLRPVEMAGATLVLFLVMIVFGQIIGFGIGVGLYVWRRTPRKRAVAVTAIGALLGGVAQLPYLVFLGIDGSPEIHLLQVAVGAVIGAGLGLGIQGAAAGRHEFLWPVLCTTIAGILVAPLRLVVLDARADLPQTLWLAAVANVCGAAILGLLAALGFWLITVKKSSLNSTAMPSR